MKLINGVLMIVDIGNCGFEFLEMDKWC